jgi:tetratricopeptide (TPR) repeat protein
MPALAATMRKLSEDVVFLHEAPAGARSAGHDPDAKAPEQSKSDRLITEALAHWDKHDVAGALAAFNAAIAAAPKSGGPIALRAMMEIEQKQTKLAEADIDKAVHLSPADPVVLDAQASLASARGRYADAIAFYTKSLALQPNAAMLAERARLHRLLGHTDDALRDYANAAVLDPGTFQYRADRWDILLSHGKAALALQEADALAAAEPRNAQVQFARSVMLFALSRKAEARIACQASIALSPTDAAYAEMARLQDDPASAQAMPYLEKALALNPNNMAARLMRGRALMRAKKFREAADDLSVALRLAPTNITLLRETADALQLSQRGGQAVQLFDRLVSLQPRNPQWLNLRCWARATSGGDLAAALADCNAAVRIDPGYAEALDSRGFVHLRRGELAAAKADYDASLRLRPEGATSLYGRAVALRRIGQEAAAASDLAAARRIRPDIDGLFAGYGVRL